MVVEIGIIGVLAGIILGLRFSVMILAPTLTVAMVIAVIAGIASGDHFWWIVMAVILVGSAVQVGYLVGIVLRATPESNSAPEIDGCNSKVGHT